MIVTLTFLHIFLDLDYFYALSFLLGLRHCPHRQARLENRRQTFK